MLISDVDIRQHSASAIPLASAHWERDARGRNGK